MNTTNKNECITKSLTPALPNYLEKLSTQPKISRLSAPQVSEDQTLTCIKKVIACARKHPKATITVGAVTILLGLYFLQEDSKHT